MILFYAQCMANLGLYAANIDTDYYRAIQWLYKGITLAQQNKYQKQYAILLANLANIYYLKKDKAGIKYALESYELGHRLNDPYIILHRAQYRLSVFLDEAKRRSHKIYS